MKTMTYLGFLSVPLCFCQHLQAQNNSRQTNPPNIIFILADDMGYGDVSAFNEHSGITTRNLDEMADNGVSFTDAHSCSSVSTPTRYGIITGRYNWRSSLKSGVLYGYSRPIIPTTRSTMASMLKQNGYTTACIGKWHLGWNWGTKAGHEKPNANALAEEDVDYSKVKITYYDKVTKENKEIEIDGFKTTSAIIDDTYQCAGEYSFTFKTYGPTGMETESPVIITGTSGEASELERVILTVDMLSANATQDGDGGGLPALIDGKGGTYYHSRWQDPVVSEAHYVQIKLNKPLQGLRFEYDARQTGINNGGDVTIATIYGSTNGEYFESMGTEEFNLPTSNGGHATAKNNVNGKQAYNYIRFTPTGRRNQATLDYTNANKAWWNMAEMYLYRVRHDEAWAKEQLGI